MVAALCLAAASITGGCYSWAPAAERVGPGEQVRAHLTPPGAVRLAEITGETDRRIEGQVVEWNGEQLVLARPRSDLPGNPRAGIGTDTIRLPLADVVEFEEQRLSRVRTGVVIAGAGVFGYGLFKLFLDRDAGGGSGGERPPPVLIRIPIDLPLVGGR